jgi:hypothetical protein
MKYVLLLLLLINTAVTAQQVTFKEIRLKPNPKYYNTTDTTIIYPVIVTGKKKAELLMNTSIKNELFKPENASLPVKRILKEHLNEYGLINLYYKVTYKKKGILSMNIYEEGCGAYCSSGYTWFNFDVNTGKAITMDDLLLENKKDSFSKIVLTDKLKALQTYKIEELDNLHHQYIDSESYRMIIEMADSNFSKSADIENYSLAANGIEIMDICELPHILRSQEPSYQLKYTYKFMAPFIKPEYRKLFLK